MKSCRIVELGVIPYAGAFALQKEIVAARKAGRIGDVLLLCEHPAVITLGRSGKREHLLASDHVLRQMGIEFHATDRGGDVTYHGPGQIVGYPILKLDEIRRDVVWYVRQLEEIMIRASADFGITAKRVAGKTGIWVDTPGGEEKLAAIGVHISRWVTSHGFAYNVATDLRHFELIVPCGIAGCRATSLERLLGRRVPQGEVAARLAHHFADVFGLAPSGMTAAQLREALQEAVQAEDSQPAELHATGV